MTVGQRLFQIRAATGLSQEDFGAHLGTTRQTVSRWELDQALPELDKLVRISRLFSVTIDSILIDGITTFDCLAEDAEAPYICGIGKSDTRELVETERVAIVYETNPERSTLSACAYVGFEDKKRMSALVEYNMTTRQIIYAYRTESGATIANSDKAALRLGERHDATLRDRLYRTESFYVARDGMERRPPLVSEVGLRRCLLSWRMATRLHADAERFTLKLCTAETEYILDIAPQDTNVYAAISFNVPTDMGLFCGKQIFRIRHYQDNTAPFCAFFASLGTRAEPVSIPTEECLSGRCANTSQGVFCGVKRYSDSEIVLAGCGGDEYVYRADEPSLERLTDRAPNREK